jgi:hypothetical protein
MFNHKIIRGEYTFFERENSYMYIINGEQNGNVLSI